MQTGRTKRKSPSSRRHGNSQRGAARGETEPGWDDWRLPSGMELVEFAWNAGFVAPLLTPKVSGPLANEESGDGEAAEIFQGGGR